VRDGCCMHVNMCVCACLCVCVFVCVYVHVFGVEELAKVLGQPCFGIVCVIPLKRFCISSWPAHNGPRKLHQ